MTGTWHRTEALCFAIIAVLAVSAAILAPMRGVRIDFASFAGHALVAAAMLAAAFAYRRRTDAPEIALTLKSCAILIAFTNAGATLNYLLLRPGAVPIDPLLMQADAALGFDWRAFAEAVSRLGPAAPALGWVYNSSLPQMVTMILFLGLTRRQVELHRFVLVGVLCGCASLAIWSIAPSIGPAPLVPLDRQVAAQLQRVVDDDYSRKLVALFEQSPTVLSADRLIGLIAFPSMHTVMAWMSVHYARRTRLFVPMVLVNALMIPAILVHGGHHLVDLLGGTVLFVAAAFLAARLVPRREAAPSVSRQAHTASGGRLIRMASMLPPVFRPNSVPRS